MESIRFILPITSALTLFPHYFRTKGAEYALKIIDKSKCVGKEHMIENEVAILRVVKHPNIIQLISEQDTPAELYLVMELVKVRSFFFTFLNNAPLYDFRVMY